MKVYVDNALNRKLNRVGKPIIRKEEDKKKILKRGIKIKINLPYLKRRVTAIYKEIIGSNFKKIIFEYNKKEYSIDIDKANLKIL